MLLITDATGAHAAAADPVSPWAGGPGWGLPWQSYFVDTMPRIKYVLRKDDFIRNKVFGDLVGVFLVLFLNLHIYDPVLCICKKYSTLWILFPIFYFCYKTRCEIWTRKKEEKGKLLTILIIFCTLTDFKLLLSSGATRLRGWHWLVAANIYRSAILAIQALIPATVLKLRSYCASFLAIPANWRLLSS